MSYKDKFYQNYVASHTEHLYGKPSLENIESQFPVWRDYFSRFLPADKNVKILDLGCGNGGFVYWLLKLGYRNVTGVDISKEQVEEARRLGIEGIIQADVSSFLKSKKAGYDLIFARDLIEHFPKEELLGFTELIRGALGEKGAFVIQTVNAKNLLWGRLREGDFTHDLAFTEQSISQLLRVSGFSEVSVYPQRPVVYGIKSFIRYLLWRIFEIFMHFYLLVETGSHKGIFTQDLIVVAKK